MHHLQENFMHKNPFLLKGSCEQVKSESTDAMEDPFKQINFYSSQVMDYLKQGGNVAATNDLNQMNKIVLEQFLTQMNRFSPPQPPTDEQQYRVKWSGHESRLLSFVEDLLNDVNSSDATVVTKEASFYVHRAVLASISPFFKKIFKDTPENERPIVILYWACPKLLRDLLAYCYTGTITIQRQNIQQLCQLGEDLQIPGFVVKSHLRDELTKPAKMELGSDVTNATNTFSLSQASSSPNVYNLTSLNDFMIGLQRQPSPVEAFNTEGNDKRKDLEATDLFSESITPSPKYCRIDGPKNFENFSPKVASAKNVSPKVSPFIKPEDMNLNSSKFGGSRILLWRFLLDLLHDSRYSPMYISWTDRSIGKFRIRDSDMVAKLWGIARKNLNMNYEKMSRGMRTYYKRGILFHIDGTKLIYRFNINDEEIKHYMSHYELVNGTSPTGDMYNAPNISNVSLCHSQPKSESNAASNLSICHTQPKSEMKTMSSIASTPTPLSKSTNENTFNGLIEGISQSPFLYSLPKSLPGDFHHLCPRDFSSMACQDFPALVAEDFSTKPYQNFPTLVAENLSQDKSQTPQQSSTQNLSNSANISGDFFNISNPEIKNEEI